MARAYRQGDVLFYEVVAQNVIKYVKDSGTSSRISSKNNHFVLAEGEVTGHAHRIEKTEEVDFRSYAGSRYLVVKPGAESVVVKHEEHNPIKLAPGTYEVIIERQYELGGQRQVRPVYD